MLGYLIQGITLGLAAAAQPGPFQAYLISQALRNGWQRTLTFALGPLISDGPIVVLVVLVLSQVPGWLQRALYIGGGLFLFYLAWQAYRAWRAFDAAQIEASPAGTQSVWQAALMNMLSPGPYMFWSLIAGPVLVQAWQETAGHVLGFLCGFYGMLIGGLMLIIVLFGCARHLGPRVVRILLAVSALVLAVFGGYQIYSGVFWEAGI